MNKVFFVKQNLLIWFWQQHTSLSQELHYCS
jgi:hypothetical protein